MTDSDSGKWEQNPTTQSSVSPRPAPRKIYVGRLKCGCAVAATVDPDDLTEMARNGYFIETVEAKYFQIAGCMHQTRDAPARETENATSPK